MAIQTTTTRPTDAEITTDDGWRVSVTVGFDGRLSVVFGREDGGDFTYQHFAPYREGDVALTLIPGREIPRTAPDTAVRTN